MNYFFFILYCMVEDYIQPILTNVKFGYGVVFDNLENQIIGSCENSFEGIILIFLFLINLVQYLFSHLLHNGKKFFADFKIFCDELLLLIW